MPAPFIAIPRDTVNEAPSGWKINYNGDARRVYVVAAGESAPETNVGEHLEMLGLEVIGPQDQELLLTELSVLFFHLHHAGHGVFKGLLFGG